ncbi:carboxypeptidase regulatory-like domain-containing protein [Actinacidiphila acididurans]|uniref:Carboxypeptidase regulatory-like domain-containing protein n=1 Tax=Actinacidiphila acididurans TaxID=2784346 RepID=A0ABS2TWD0_9ACTN|nr:carboxypeptidase regulatory-like domain-containing protein [Actinacidiphila acididurans]MBM9507647.1 carboxypeptidase regulatory-like domain-containing protein [Actinacidiphila acididurans]
MSAATAAVLAVLAALAVLLPQQAVAAPAGTGTGSASGPVSAVPACGTPQPGHFGCFAMRRTDVHATLGVRRLTAGQAATPAGYSPADLLSAYNLPADGGAGATIAVVDAFDDPTAEADLAVYRAQYGLPECTTANGCFSKVDQRGGTDYPVSDEGWAGEISLDLDMVSAIAPKAHILLVEADQSTSDSLGAAENAAVALGARYVSNSWGSYGDDPANLAYDESYFNHPGVAVVFSSGDDGYGVSYPASSPYVTSVGGTSLVRDGSARGWNESVWNGITTDASGAKHWGAPGSGCSTIEPRPDFQSAVDCSGRSVADVSAVADPATGVAVYNSFSDGGWNVYGGTSASAPIIASVYALAGTPVTGSYPAAYPYQATGALNDVTQGDDASCADASLCGYGTTPDCTPLWTCAAQPGYDGPTGLGTPDGTAAFRAGPHGTVTGTVTDAATHNPLTGATVSLGDHTATTDAKGGYRLDVPAGSYDLKVTAFGYADLDLGSVQVADGAGLTENAALTAVPSQTVSGTVRDGGGHGWGLYAQITLDGVPGTVYTDPATGHYSVKVPKGHTYTLHATSLWAGYQQGTTTVTAGNSPATGDFTLPLSTTGALPQGYETVYRGGGLQSFAGSSAPDGWTVKNNTSAGGWNFDDPLNRGNQTGGSGRFAEVDDFALGWAPADTELLSPAYDFTGVSDPQLQFDTALPTLYRLGSLTADVDVSTDGGTTWSTVWHHTDVVPGPAHETVPLKAYAGDKNVRLRFHYTGSLTGIWEIDNVAVGTPTLVTRPGGLLVGTVTDANTGAGVLGATVTAAAVPADSGRVVAAPGDPAATKGLYAAFSSRTGEQKFTAGLPGFGYPPVTGPVKVRANGTTRADFLLHPAKLGFASSSVTAKVPAGGSRSVTVEVRNTGGSAATFSLGERDLGTTPPAASSAPAQRVPSTVTPDGLLKAAPKAEPKTASANTRAPSADPATDPAWSSLANLPTGEFGGVSAVIGGTLYEGLGEEPGGVWSNAFRSYDPATATWKTEPSPVTRRIYPAYGVIRGKLYVTGGRDAAGNPITSGEVFDPATGTWSQIADAPRGFGAPGAAVVGDKLYVIGGCDFGGCGYNMVQVYDPATDTWSSGPQYPEPISFTVCGTVDGAITCSGGAYQPADATPKDTSHTYVLDTAAGAWRRVADAPADFWGATGTAADGALLVAGGQQISANALTSQAFAYHPDGDTWSALPALPQPVLGAQSAPGWFAIGGMNAYSVPQQAAYELPGYDRPYGDVPWLSEQARQLTVPAHATVTVRVTLDAGAMTAADAGAHRAALVLDGDTPYAPATLPVTMTVVPPAGS